jgi:hypothetical protein
MYAGASWERFSIGLEGQADLPASHRFAAGASVTAWLVAGALVPCLRLAPLELCALAVLGRLDATASGVVSPTERVGPYVGLGGRLGVELPVSAHVSLAGHGDLIGNIYETTLVAGPTQAWMAPAVGGVVALGALATF